MDAKRAQPHAVGRRVDAARYGVDLMHPLSAQAAASKVADELVRSELKVPRAAEQ